MFIFIRRNNMMIKRLTFAGVMTILLLVIVLPATEVFAATIGYFAPSSASSAGPGWTNPANALTSNNLYATAKKSNKKLTASSFNVTAIPGNATIDGIEVTVEGYHSAGSTLNVKVALWNASSGTWSSSKTTSLTTSDSTFTLGSSSDLWGKTWSANDFANANFKIQLTSTGSGGTIYIDQVQMRVHYTPGNTTLTLSPVSGSYGGTTDLIATFTETSTGNPISGKTIDFTLNGASAGSATTDASGVATLSNVSLSGIDAGSYPNGAGASFAGDGSYQATSITAALDVDGTATTLTVDPASGVYVGSESGTINLSATLTETVSGSPISGKTVSLTMGGVSIGSGTTDASGYVTVSGASLTGYDAGAYMDEIVASFSNSGAYEGSTGSGTLTVNPKELTITGVTANNKMYDTTTAAVLDTGSAALSGVISGDSVTLDISGAMGFFSDANVGVGKTVTTSGFAIGGDAGNYILTQPTATADITAYPITVTADAQSKTYGDADPSFTYTNTPLLGSDTFSGSLSRAAGENVGTYAINQGTLTAGGNYSITFVGASLTINAKTITVTADAMSKTYGDADPSLTYSNTPLLGSDTFSGSLSRVAGENVGTYAINQGTLTAGENYSITFVGANLTINAKTITVTADSKSKTYGDPDPIFTYGVEGFVSPDTFITDPTCSVPAPHDTAGEYEIVCLGGNAGANYNIAYVNGILTVTSTADPSPTVLSITRAGSSPTSADSVDFTVTFSEDVTGVNTDDFALTTTGVSGAAVSEISGSGSIYTVTVNTGSGNGTIRLDVVDDDSILDGSSNPLGGINAGNGNHTGGEKYSVVKSSSFGDVSISNPYLSYIEILYINGYTGGCSTSPLLFCPDMIMNRAQAAVFMLRGNFGSGYIPVTPTHFFKDNWLGVPRAEGWAESMYLEGLTAGCSPSPLKFCPNDQLTNVQAAVFGLRLKYGMNYTPPAPTGTVFADLTDLNFWGTGWAEQAYADGLIPACGTSGGKPMFCPNNLVNRGFGAYIIVLAKNLAMP
jgi:hypothetical protein